MATRKPKSSTKVVEKQVKEKPVKESTPIKKSNTYMDENGVIDFDKLGAIIKEIR